MPTSRPCKAARCPEPRRLAPTAAERICLFIRPDGFVAKRVPDPRCGSRFFAKVSSVIRSQKVARLATSPSAFLPALPYLSVSPIISQEDGEIRKEERSHHRISDGKRDFLPGHGPFPKNADQCMVMKRAAMRSTRPGARLLSTARAREGGKQKTSGRGRSMQRTIARATFSED